VPRPGDVPSPAPVAGSSLTAGGALDGLFAEAERQLNICNACRYCEGYCAVFPALERRMILSPGDVSHLANLCHDCRACLYACMYAPPHEFGVNPPQLLSEVRARTWEEHAAPALLRDRPGRHPRAQALVAVAVAAGIMVALAGATEGLGHLWRARRGATSPYDVISYPAILVVMSVPFAWALVALAWAGARYWRHTRGRLAELWNLPAWRAAVVQAGQLRYLKGGGAGCPYPGDRPSAARRHLHAAVAYGFLACLVSTVSAGVTQDLAGSRPPYPLLSVPVVAGTLGGMGLVVGSVGLLALGVRSDPQATDEAMAGRNEHLLAGLALLGATGVAVLATRGSTAYGPVLVLHLAAVAVAFAVAPLTKFNHVLYRLLALVQDNLERSGPLPTS
jgi:citrate/tricarballylate utilization protein